MPTFRFKIPVLAALLCCRAAFANDGFYQGGGSSLRPLENLQMRVVEEKLLIHPLPEPVCYRLRFRGKFLDEWNRSVSGDVPPLKQDEFAEVADPTPCQPGRVPSYDLDLLLSLWQVQADYQVESLADQESVQMGFPVPVWEAVYSEPGGFENLPAPSVANFRTFIDGKLVENPQLTWLEVPDPKDKSAGKTLGFTWRASFRKGRKYNLHAEYDFGASYSGGFYPGREYRQGEEPPWFITSPEKDEVRSHEAVIMEYYLSPLRAWGAQPPERISIEVRRPPGVPSSYLVPITPKPSCVDAYSLYYEYRNAYPDTELEISMPEWLTSTDWGEPPWPEPETPEQLRRWQQTLGSQALIADVGCPCERQKPAIMVPDFMDFPVSESYSGPIAEPDVTSDPKARMFSTMLRESTSDGVNFAGRYILASWGCGSGCVDGGIIDAGTGNVYFDSSFSGISWAEGTEFNYVGRPDGVIGSKGFGFHPDSRLLFVSGVPANPAIADWGVMNALSVLVWDNHALRLLYRAYGAIQDGEMYDYNYNYYARLQRKYAIDQMLKYATYHDRANAVRLAEILIEHPEPFSHPRDSRIARSANARGLEALQKKDLTAAVLAFETGALADGLDAEILNNLGYTYLQQGKLEDAERTLRNALLHSPKLVNAWVNIGQVFAEQNNSELAAASFILALQLSDYPGRTSDFLLRFTVPEKPSDLSRAVENALKETSQKVK